MSSHRSPSDVARTRLGGFNTLVWVAGLIVVLIAGIAGYSNLDDGGRVSEDYRYEPWLNPDPVLAEDEGGGVWSGIDTAMIPLDGLDPTRPILVTAVDDTYLGDITVTGPGGEYEIEGAYGDPPEFNSYFSAHDLGQYIVVPGPEVELWVDGLSDERWRVKITYPELEELSGTVSGVGDRVFLYRAGGSTARISPRGDYPVTVETVSVTGSEEVYSELDPVDRSIAWDDADLMIFIVTSYESAWTIEFDEPAPEATPGVTGTPGPEASPTPTAGSDG